MTIDEFFILIDYPVHWPTYDAALRGSPVSMGRWLRRPMEREKAVRMCRRCLWLIRLRGATNGKYGRHFGSEQPS